MATVTSKLKTGANTFQKITKIRSLMAGRFPLFPVIVFHIISRSLCIHISSCTFYLTISASSIYFRSSIVPNLDELLISTSDLFCKLIDKCSTHNSRIHAVIVIQILFFCVCYSLTSRFSNLTFSGVYMLSQFNFLDGLLIMRF